MTSDNYQAPYQFYWRHKSDDLLAMFGTWKAQYPLMALHKSAREDIVAYASMFVDSFQTEYETDGRVVADRVLLAALHEDSVDLSALGALDDDMVAITRDRIELIAACLGHVSGVDVYAPEEFSSVLQRGDLPQADMVRLCHTLRMVAMGQDSDEYIDYIMPFLSIQGVYSQRNFLWKDAVIHRAMLDAVWSSFLRIDDEDKYLLLQYYLYRGIVSGLPITSIVRTQLTRSMDPIDLVYWYDFFIASIDKNVEEIPVKTDGNEYTPFHTLFSDFVGKVGDNLADGLPQQQYIRDMYNGQKGRDTHISWLQELFFVTTRLKRGTIIEQAAYEDPTPATKLRQELVQLISWQLDQEQWPHIASYYAQSHPQVSLGVFLSELRVGYDLTKEDAIHALSSFSQFLRNSNIIPADAEIILYNEQTGVFAWNTEFVYSI